MQRNKKIINDPVYGFISFTSGGIIHKIIEDPYFQRLRRIRQLGLTDMVYPGALHTRFHHAIGAMHLMETTLDMLRTKGIMIFESEYEGALLAILLHDIGHGPFSHALENTILKEVHHEKISELFFKSLNTKYEGALSVAIQIFNDKYPRRFFHQLVSSQLDIDRLDYLNRDSYFTGVSEGVIGSERIIKMLNVVNDQLVVEEKGIYSIENFLTARRIMYWQVYLHKTTVSAEELIIQIIRRAKHLVQQGENIMASPALLFFLNGNCKLSDFESNPDLLHTFSLLDDFDIWGAIKFWQSHSDKVLNTLSNMLLNRKLFKVTMSNVPFDNQYISMLKNKTMTQLQLTEEELKYFFIERTISNSAYLSHSQNINILSKNGYIMDITEASDLPNIKALTQSVSKYYLCFPKSIV